MCKEVAFVPRNLKAFPYAPLLSYDVTQMVAGSSTETSQIDEPPGSEAKVNK